MSEDIVPDDGEVARREVHADAVVDGILRDLEADFLADHLRPDGLIEGTILAACADLNAAVRALGRAVVEQLGVGAVRRWSR